MAIKIPFIAEVDKFLGGTRSIEDSLDDVADALDDVSKAGDDVDDSVGADLDSVAKQADASADKVRRSFTDAFDDVEKQGRTSTGKVKADLKSTGDSGSTTMREFSDEAKQNVSETVSSFDGSASSAVDAVQGTFGGLVSALGPAGVVGAAVAGVGIGLARSLFGKAQERAERVAEAVAEVAAQFIDLGTTTLGVDQVNDKLKELASTAASVKFMRDDDSVTELDKLSETADKAKISWRDYARGVAGDTTSLQKSYDEVTAKLQGYESATQAVRYAKIYEIHALEDARDKLLEMDGTLDAATATATSYADATDDGAQATKDSAEAIEEENDRLRENSDLKGEAVASELDMLDALAGVTEARKENGKSLDKNTRAGRDNLRAIKEGVDGINDFADAQIEAGKSADEVNGKLKTQEEALVRKVAKAFGISEKAARDYIKTLGGIPRKKETEVTVTDSGTVKTTQEAINDMKGKDLHIPVHADTSKLDKEIQNHLNKKTYKVGMSPRTGQNVFV